MGEGLQELTSEGRRGGHVQREGKKEVFACCRRVVSRYQVIMYISHRRRARGNNKAFLFFSLSIGCYFILLILIMCRVKKNHKLLMSVVEGDNPLLPSIL